MQIPFNKISTSEYEATYLLDAIKNVGGRKYTDKCSDWISNEFSVDKVYMTSSGTSALELALLTVITEDRNEVIIPSFTFPSVANAVLTCGGKPVFCEVDNKNMCIDIEDYKNKITDRTIAVVPVHYGGLSYYVDEVMRISKENKIYVVEDAAHGFLSYNKGKALGTIGDFGFYSFHATKNIGCGDGGALLINTKDEAIRKRIAYLYHNGTNREEFFEGKATNYNWKTYGLNPYPAELAMAFLYGQLETVKKNTLKRKEIFDIYYNFFSENKLTDVVEYYTEKPDTMNSNCHIFFLIFKNNNTLKQVIDKLETKNIISQFHFMPLHSSEMAQTLGYKSSDLPITDSVSRRILRLPLYNEMTPDEANYVLDSLSVIFKELHK